MKIFISILVLILGISAFSDNACRQPYKLNASATPFYANRHKMDSMFDGTGKMVSYEYDSSSRVIKSGNTKFEYLTDYRYSSTDEETGLNIEYFDNQEKGADSMLFFMNAAILWKTYFRFSALYDVFENWRYASGSTSPYLSRYDSIAYNQESLYHYRYEIVSGKKYEYSEACESRNDSCKCAQIHKDEGYPFYIEDSPIFIYDKGNLIEKKYGKIFHHESSSSNESSSSSATVSILSAKPNRVAQPKNSRLIKVNGKPTLYDRSNWKVEFIAERP